MNGHTSKIKNLIRNLTDTQWSLNLGHTVAETSSKLSKAAQFTDDDMTV